MTRRQNRVAQYNAMRPIMDLCEQSILRPGAWLYRQWWEQEGLDLEGAKEKEVTESDGEEEKRGEGAV